MINILFIVICKIFPIVSMQNFIVQHFMTYISFKTYIYNNNCNN